MNYTQNEKIKQVIDTTLVVGVDIGSRTHYVGAFDNRGCELTKQVFSFQNDLEGFNSFYFWADKLRRDHGKTEVMIGRSLLVCVSKVCSGSSDEVGNGQSFLC